jgi:hypothetical protein
MAGAASKRQRRTFETCRKVQFDPAFDDPENAAAVIARTKQSLAATKGQEVAFQ